MKKRFSPENRIEFCGQEMRKKRILNDKLSEIDQEIQNADAETDISPLLGKRDAIIENIENGYESLCRKQIEVIQTINNIDDSDYIDAELPYLQGYLSGVYFVIKTNSTIFRMDIPFTLVVFSLSKDIINNYELALSCIPRIKKVGEGSQKQYFVTDSIAEIRSLQLRENEEIAVFAICERGTGADYIDVFPELSSLCGGNLYYSFEEVADFEIRTPESQIKKLLRKTIIPR